MAAMIKAGKIRHYGLSNETAWGVCEFHRVAQASSACPGRSRRRTATACVSRGVDNDLAEALFREKMSLLAYSPLAGGHAHRQVRGRREAAGRALSRCSTASACASASRSCHEAVDAYAALAKRARHHAGAARARLRAQPLARRRDDHRRDDDAAASREHRSRAVRSRRRDAAPSAIQVAIRIRRADARSLARVIARARYNPRSRRVPGTPHASLQLQRRPRGAARAGAAPGRRRDARLARQRHVGDGDEPSRQGVHRDRARRPRPTCARCWRSRRTTRCCSCRAARSPRTRSSR